MRKTIWKSKSCPWQHLTISYGIYKPNKWLTFPIRNMSDNCNRSIMIGLWKMYFIINYSRDEWFNHKRYLPLRNIRFVLNFYKLVI